MCLIFFGHKPSQSSGNGRTLLCFAGNENSEGFLVLAFCAVLVVVGWPVLLWVAAKHKFWPQPPQLPSPQKKRFAVEREDLVRRMTIGEIELGECVNDPLGAVPDLPFGHLHGVWEVFKSTLTPGDDLWSFSTGRKCGLKDDDCYERHAGYAAVNNDEIRKWFLTTRRILDEKEENDVGEGTFKEHEEIAFTER